MLIFIAHNGKTLDLDVQAATRVDAVQQALSSLTSIPEKEQILLLHGNPLDPNKTLGAYKLPTEDAGSPKDVFLYTKAHLRQHVAMPEPETVVLPKVDVAPPGSIQYEPHILDSAPSPLLQTLPNYERQFRYHLQKAQAHLEVSYQREQICKQLLSEQEVQAMSIDAARVNVEHHFQYIARAFEDFMATYQTEAAAQQQILQGFQWDMEQLAGLELHAGARTERHSRLIHLIPEQKMWEWSARCKHDHDHFAKKVGELKATFSGLQLDVEAMFMQMPSVDLDELGSQLEAMQQHQQEQASIVDVLQSDLAKIESLVKDAMRQLSTSVTNASVRPLDACEVMEAMNRHHLQDLIPRLERADSSFEALCLHCLDCKNCMTKDVVAQLQKISTQQSKIKALKGKLAVYQDVANKQAETFAELQLVKRVPVAYRHCLAECMRRQAFWESYSKAANDAAHALSALRNREAAVRDVFKRAVSRLIPPQVLQSMGLQSEVPLCSIKLSAPEVRLLDVKSDDLLQLPKTPQGPVHSNVPFPDPRKPQQDMTASQALQPIPGMLAASRALSGSIHMPRQGLPATVPEEQEGSNPSSPSSTDNEVQTLRQQNAKLRDQLATLVFQQCLVENPPRQTLPNPSHNPPQPSTSASQMLRQASDTISAQTTIARMPSVSLNQSVLFRAPSNAASQMLSHAGQPERGSPAMPGQQGVTQQHEEERKAFGLAIDAKDERIKELADQLSAMKQKQKAEGSSYQQRIHSLEGMLTQASLSASSQAATAVATDTDLASQGAPTSVQSTTLAATAGVQPIAVASPVASAPPPAATAACTSPDMSAAHSQQIAGAAASSSANSQHEAAADQPASHDNNGAEAIQAKLHQQRPVGTESEAPSSDAAAKSQQIDISSLAVTGSFSA